MSQRYSISSSMKVCSENFLITSIDDITVLCNGISGFPYLSFTVRCVMFLLCTERSKDLEKKKTGKHEVTNYIKVRAQV